MSLSFNYASDLHIDMGHTLPEFPGGKLLILAGDTCEARLLQKNIPDPNGILDRDIIVSNRDRINGFMRKLSEIYEHVIIVAGNHDHYHMEFGKTIARMREHLPDNFHVLDQDCFELEDVLFVGATLWTDMNKYDPMTIHATKDMLNDFFEYWTEPNKSHTKMLFETKQTWDTSRRLSRWERNNRKGGKA